MAGENENDVWIYAGKNKNVKGNGSIAYRSFAGDRSSNPDSSVYLGDWLMVLRRHNSFTGDTGQWSAGSDLDIEFINSNSKKHKNNLEENLKGILRVIFYFTGNHSL